MRVSAPRGPALKEKVHETCGQDVDPDGRSGLHVCGGFDSDVCSSGWRTDSVQPKDRLPEIGSFTAVKYSPLERGLETQLG